MYIQTALSEVQAQEILGMHDPSFDSLCESSISSMQEGSDREAN